jgi:transposase
MLELRMHEAHLLRRQGLTVKDIALELGKSERTVYHYLSEPPRRRKQRRYQSKLDPFKPTIDSILNDTPDYNRVVLSEKLAQAGYTGGMTILRDYAAGKTADITRQAVIRYETVPGFQAQVDWKEHGTRVVDGKKCKLYAFTFVFGYSRDPFVMHTTRMDQATLLACHVKAFEHFGGVPREILYDNMKTAFLMDGEGRWKPNRQLLALANHYGFIPRRCRVRRPQTKGKVERFIEYYTNNFWLGVSHDDLRLDVLNEQVHEWIARIRRKPIRELSSSRAERFAKERPCLIPLPATRYDCNRTVTVRVSRESLVLYQTNWYSVPPEIIGKDVMLAVDPFLPKAQVSLEGRFIREIELAINEKHGRFFREEDRKALHALWERQQDKPAAAGACHKAEKAVAVAIRKPAEYEKLVSGWGVA